MIFGEGPIIKNIAGDLNKLFLQGTRAGQPINNVEGDAAADQATVQLMADRDPVIRDISTGLGWAGREVTVSGTGALQLVNSLGRPLKSWSVELAPKQDLNGYNSPWPAGGGANKWDIANIQNGYIDDADGVLKQPSSPYRNTGYIEVQPSTSYYVYTEQTESAWGAWYDVDKNYIIGVRGYTADGIPVITSPSNAKYVRLTIQSNSTGNPNTFAFNYPATVTTYSPYSNICPIYGTDKLNMFVEEYYDQSATPKAIITLPQTVYTGTVGNNGGDNRYAEVDMGSLLWNYDDNYSRFYSTTLTDVMAPAISVRRQLLYCEQFNVITDGRPITEVPNASLYSATDSNGTRIYVHDRDYNTISAFTSAVTGIKLLYPLAILNQFNITDPTVPTIEGDAYAWVTAENGIVTNFSATYLQSK